MLDQNFFKIFFSFIGPLKWCESSISSYLVLKFRFAFRISSRCSSRNPFGTISWIVPILRSWNSLWNNRTCLPSFSLSILSLHLSSHILLSFIHSAHSIFNRLIKLCQLVLPLNGISFDSFDSFIFLFSFGLKLGIYLWMWNKLRYNWWNIIFALFFSKNVIKFSVKLIFDEFDFAKKLLLGFSVPSTFQFFL